MIQQLFLSLGTANLIPGISNLVAAPIISLAALGSGTTGGKLWQDTGRTTQAKNNNDPVRLMDDPFVAGVTYTAPSDSARPLLQTDGTYYWLQGDGSSKYMSASISWPTGITIGGKAFMFSTSNTALEQVPGGAVVGANAQYYESIYLSQLYAQSFRSTRGDSFAAGVTWTNNTPLCISCESNASSYLTTENGTTLATSTELWDTPTNIYLLAGNNNIRFLAGNFYGGIVTSSSWNSTIRSAAYTYLNALV